MNNDKLNELAFIFDNLSNYHPNLIYDRSFCSENEREAFIKGFCYGMEKAKTITEQFSNIDNNPSE